LQRPTLSDLAREAGVSLATVDRVMNERAGVSARNRAHVLTTARRLGYLEADETSQGHAQSAVRIAFVLPQGTNAFILELENQVKEQAQHMNNVTAVVEPIVGLDPSALAVRLNELRGKVDGIAIVAMDHPAVREAIRALLQAGTLVVTIATDIPTVPHQGYIGIDNGQAGRLAGYLLGRLIGANSPATVAFFAGSLSYRGHQEREMGFRQILSEDFPNIELVERHEIHEDRREARARTATLLKDHPNLAGIYNAGGATLGIATALSEHKSDQKIVFVAHDMTSQNKALLLDGTLDAVIDQNARIEVREALSALVHAARGQKYRIIAPRLQIIFRENLPVE